MKDLLDAALLDKLEQRHHMLYRQASAKLLKKGIITVQVIIRSRHLEQTLGTYQLFAFDKAVKASPAIPRIKQGDEILENSVGG